MAGTTYDMSAHPKIERLGDVKPGVNYLQIKIDFTKTPVDAADDNWKILKVSDEWIFLAGFTRNTASSSTATVDVGTAEDGTEFDTAIDISTALTSWTVMDTLKDGTAVIITADGYIWLDFNTAAVTDGVLEFLFVIACGAGDDSYVG